MRIDAHQHFWIYDAQEHTWIDDTMRAVQRDFLPPDLKPVLQQAGFDGCVTVQVAQSELETEWFLQMANQHDFIKGVVGWTDLQARNVEAKLERLRTFPKLKGIRHLVQGERDPEFLNRPAFRNGIKQLQRYNLTYDILIYPHQLKAAVDFAAVFPEQKFVLDHLAKPYIKKGLIDEWHGDLKKLAALDNVWCKVSGLVTEADWQQHKLEDFVPYIEAAIETFGIDRLMFGSDWPVCLVSASYEQVVKIAHEVLKNFSADEQEKFWGLNAINFYNLNNA